MNTRIVAITHISKNVILREQSDQRISLGRRLFAPVSRSHRPDVLRESDIKWLVGNHQTESLDKTMEANIINERTFVFTKEGNYACQVEGYPDKR
jgi:hypothetical protein